MLEQTKTTPKETYDYAEELLLKLKRKPVFFTSRWYRDVVEVSKALIEAKRRGALWAVSLEKTHD